MNSSNPPLHSIDAKGLKCPMPIIKLQQFVRSHTPCTQPLSVAIHCTDPSAKQDIQSWANVNKHLVTQTQNTDYGCIIYLTLYP